MLNSVENVLFQILIILLPILLYHLFFYEKNIERKRPNSKLTFILLLMLLLAMSFPVQFEKGYIYDFRIIPFIIAFCYGGRIPGLIIASALLLYRYLIGGDGFYVILITYSLISIFLIFTIRKYEELHLKYKLLFVSSVFWLIMITVAITLFKMGQYHQIKFMIIFYLISWASLLMVVFLIENINQQQLIREELQKADKLNVISQLAASVAHEVRNPMTSVRGFLQLIIDDKNLQKTQKNYIGIAINELDHAQSIINDYLSLARPHTEELTSINISDEVKKTIELMTSYSNIQNISIKTYIQDALFIRGDKSEIKQVLVNIMKNGIEAMERGGTLSVNTFEKDGFVSIEIIDSGKGMTKSQQKRLGTPFYTTKEKGTGVGLTISFQIVQSMKGKIMVESKLGTGTIFTLQFPIIKLDTTEQR